MMHRRLALLACVLLIAAFVGQCACFLRASSQTIDEAAYLGAGYSYLARRDFRLMPEHPPLMKLLAALPVYLVYRLPFEPDPKLWQEAHPADVWPIGLDFLYASAIDADRILLLARLPSVVLGALLTALVGWWSYRLWGPGAAVVGTALAAFEPNLIAHSCLVGTDLGVTFFFFLTLYLLWEYTQRPSCPCAIGVGGAAGLAMSSKFSGVLAVGVVLLVLLAWVVQAAGVERESPGEGRRRAGQAVRLVVVLLVGAALVIVAVYFFQGYSTFGRGFRWLSTQQMQGRSAFFRGEYSEQGWLSYYPVAFALKTPLPSLLLILASLLFHRWGRPLGRREVLFLLLPPAVILAAATYSRTNIGLRYVLPIYPFLFVLAARLATLEWRRTWMGPVVLGLPLLATTVSALRIAPHHLAYFNELAGGPAGGSRYLSDSNIDWGQDLKNLKDFLDREGVAMIYLAYFGVAPPEHHGIRYQYLPAGDLPRLRPPPTDLLPAGLDRELLAVSVVCLHGQYYQKGRGRELYHWLARRQPIARIGYSILVYDITGDAEAHRELARISMQAGLVDAVLSELQKAAALDPARTEVVRDLQVLLVRRHQLLLGGLQAAAPHGPLPCLPIVGAAGVQ
jgi:4-amino-4-deoxy-L-arabinose transferase-like glycosyltransferase